MTRDFSLKVKTLEDSGSFEGVASPYGDPPDLLGDVIAPGAYRQAIASQGRGFPLLWSHRQDEPIGLAKLEDSSTGLLVHGQLLLHDPAGARAHAHLKMGSVKGLSVGFLPATGEGKVSRRGDGARVLHEVRLFEISIVAVPAAPRAQITSVKSLNEVRHVLKSFRDDQVNDEALADLEAIDHELKRLLLPKKLQDAAVLSEFEKFAADLRARWGSRG